MQFPNHRVGEVTPSHPVAVNKALDREEIVQNLQECRSEEGRRSRVLREEQSRTFSFYNDDDLENDEHSEEEDTQEEGMEEHTHSTDLADIHNAHEENYPTEAEKRKERRHKQATREREAERRRQEGLPRNYLLIELISRLPYGQGVGAWQKELKLLSRKLDPAIGNINKQPLELLKEIAEWIQHRWEYQAPISDRFLKDVIARGVSLRRSKLWKKIRAGERKPDDVTDRSWRSLARELENPATIRKAEICSRQNFGRTGPSGEVGVRERLRKKLRRSPDREEVNFEMARDKGYGSRSKRNKPTDTIMHGSRDEHLHFPLPQNQKDSGPDRESPQLSTSPGETRERRLPLQDGCRADLEIAANTNVSSGVLSM